MDIFKFRNYKTIFFKKGFEVIIEGNTKIPNSHKCLSCKNIMIEAFTCPSSCGRYCKICLKINECEECEEMIEKNNKLNELKNRIGGAKRYKN